MPLGYHDMDGWPSTNQKREIQTYVARAWRLWERGGNPGEIHKGLVDQARDKSSGFYMDYFPPEPAWVASAVEASFRNTTRKDYRLLGREDIMDCKSYFLSSRLRKLFQLSEQEALQCYNTRRPSVVMSQEWPASLPADSWMDPEDLRRKTDRNIETPRYWDNHGILGEYLPKDNKIVLYSRGIRRAGHALALDLLHLTTIVCLHEVAHWSVHYCPVDGYGEPWDTESYLEADDTIHETLAQWAAFHQCVADKALSECFLKLNDHQSQKYQEYRQLDDVDPVLVAASIGRLRNGDSTAGSHDSWLKSLHASGSE